MKRQTCTDHCVKCGLHFHGLSAFDAHISEGAYHEEPSSLLNRKGQPKLQIWTDGGSCDKERGCWVNGVRDHYVEGITIWQMAKTPEQAASLASLNAPRDSTVKNLTGLGG